MLAHDWLVGYRGGEAVLEAIARLLNRRADTITHLLAMFDGGKPLAPAIDALPRVCSGIGRLPASRHLRRWMLPLYPMAVGQLSRVLAREHAKHPIDAVISTSSAAIKGLRPPAGVAHLCYCHSPARYLWGDADAYRAGSGGGLRALGLRLFAERLRHWDRATASHVTTFIANSTHTRELIRHAYGRDARVIFPPVRTGFFTPPEAFAERRGWLYAGALEPYKRVDLAIEAAVRANRELTIVGDGSQADALRRLAHRLDSRHSLVQFAGRIDDEGLREAYRRAKVVLFPQIEDFGIVAVEAQACATPVAAMKAGGARDSVIPGTTGEFMQAHTPEALAEAALKCEGLTTSEAGYRLNAERFSEAAFDRDMQRAIDEMPDVPR